MFRAFTRRGVFSKGGLVTGRGAFSLGTGGGRVPVSALMSQRIRAEGYTTLNSTTTYAQAWALEAPFDFVRLILANDSAVAYEIEGASIAPSAKRNDDMVPLTAADGAVAFTRMTFGNGGAFTALGDQPASPTAQTLVVPTTADGTNPAIFASDWSACSSLDRADAGQTLPLLFARFKTTTALNGRAIQGLANDDFTAALKWPNVSQGRVIRCQRRASNWFTTGVWSGTLLEQGLLPILGVQTISRAPGISWMVGGDSLFMGESSTIDANSFGFQAACLLSTAIKPVTLINAGWSGQTYTQIYNRLLREIDLFRPSIVTFPAMSVNGAPSTQGDHDAMMVQFNALIAYAQARGCRVVPSTYPPFNLSLARDDLRKAHNDTLRARAAAGEFKLIDYDAEVTDGASPAKTISGYLGADLAHINDAGHAAIAANRAAPVLATIF